MVLFVISVSCWETAHYHCLIKQRTRSEQTFKEFVEVIGESLEDDLMSKVSKECLHILALY